MMRFQQSAKVLVFTLFFFCCAARAGVIDSPKKIGLAGAGRSGILTEPLFTNPAALTYLNSSYGFGYYGMPRIGDWDAGGKQMTVGALDGENEYAHAGFAYTRESRAILLASGGRGYKDRSIYTLGVGRKVLSSVDMGVVGRYVIRRDGGPEEKFFDGDAGALLEVFSGMQLGITYENFAYRGGEAPPILGAGIHYALLGSLALNLDGARAMKGISTGRKQWNYGLEMGMTTDLVARGGFWQDSIQGLRGSAFGFSWQGPRTSFDYGVRLTRHAPVQREHVLGITVQL